MGRSKEVETNVELDSTVNGIEFDDTLEPVEMKAVVAQPTVKEEPKSVRRPVVEDDRPKVNILRNERICVRFVPREGKITNPKHVLYGGMAETAARYYTVPKLQSGVFVNVLTDEEKAFLEDALGLDYNALSIYKKKDNYWSGYTVRLTKQDNYFDLSNPQQYIDYKVLLANKDFIAASLSDLQDYPRATYQFVIVSEGEENKKAKDSMSATMKCYKEFGKIENDADILRVIIETIDGRPTSSNTKLEFLQTKVNNLIQADSKLFLKVITDPYLNTKVLLKKSVDNGVVVNRDNHYYLRDGMLPLCENNEEATFNTAAKFLNSPKHQEILFTLQAKTQD